VSTFVVVHGAWGGGWEWADVARDLRVRGHDVFTPTLTGLGERSHLHRGQPIGLATHVADVVASVRFEDLADVVLCGASSGGVPVTGAAHELGDRVQSVVYIDALVPASGQSALDLLPAPFAALVRDGLDQHGPAWRVPIPPDLREALVPPGSLPDDRRTHYLDRLRDHPAASLADPLRLPEGPHRKARAFVRCTGGALDGQADGDPIEAGAARARAEGWPYRELDAPHDPQLFEPAGLTEVLHDLASTR
jgi:alpha-beta hydrolase superfamily lysophospholipase